MTEEIEFYTNPMSRGQIGRWMLHEVGAPYDQHILSYEDGMKSADYLAINPMGKVPAIVHKGKVVTECAAICAYLADAFPQAGLAPATEDRADYYRWLFFAAGPVEAAVTNRAAGFDPTAEQGRMFGYGSYDRAIGTLDAALSASDYICGSRFTAADVYIGAQVTWGTMFGTIHKTPAFERYVERVTSRPAYKAAKAIDDALIAAMKSQ
ncbi:glutathione S-transferase family protein [Sphingobium sp. CR28]|uniref:glutathione S-transferase family protein n=1 Tax=Sphingobium sp. CR28 TaxID=3400272 RepID=UPI003FEE6F3D